jgi:hypothetical protein
MKKNRINKVMDFSNWNQIVKLTDFCYPWRDEKVPLTEFRAYYDDTYLHFLFVSSGSKPLVYVNNNNKMEVIHSERVEMFFRSDESMKPYYCLEIDPYGRILDYRANFYREFDRNWFWPESLFIQSKISDKTYSVQGKISLFILDKLGLLKNNEIQIGLFRGHCTELKGDIASIKWISWVDPKTKHPDFHVPSAFGLFIL